MLNLNALSEEQLKRLAALAKSSIYLQRKWKTILKFTPKQAIEKLRLVYLKYIDMEGFPVIIKKKRHDGKDFLKMEIPLTIGVPLEFDLSYEHSFREDDHFDPESLMIGVEEFMEDQHLYVTGTVI